MAEVDPMAALGGEGEEAGPLEPEEADESGEDAAIDAFMVAMKKGDKGAARSEFKAAIEACVARQMKGEY